MRYAIRTLTRSPAFTVIAIATIAIGIAANTAIFSVVNGVLLRPFPFADEARVVKVTTVSRDGKDGNHSAGSFMDLLRNNRTLAALAGIRVDVFAAAADGTPAQLQGAWVTPQFFDVAGTPAALGRTFTGAEPPGEAVAVLGFGAWQQLFGGSAAVIGRRIRINGDPYTVVAVMPKTFEWPERAALWLRSPLPVPPSPILLKDPLTNRDVQYFQGVARLKPGVTISAAQQDLQAVSSAGQQDAGTTDNRPVRLTPIREDLVGDVRNALLLIQAAVGLVLLIACANVSSLLIARATGRRRELAIRAALGAGRGHLIRQLLVESLVLAIAGGAVGLLLSSWLLAVLLRIMPSGLPRTDAIRLDVTVMVVTLLASLATGLLFGILPALQASRTDAGSVIKESGDRGSRRARGRSALVIAEIALTLVLLAGAGLLANSFLRLQRVDSGFRPGHVTIADLMVPQNRYPKGADQTGLYRRLLQGLSERPELQAIGVGFPQPFHGDSASGSFSIEGRAPASRGDRPFAHIATVSGGYFSAMGIPLLSGRTFTDRDGENAQPVAIVSATLANEYWPGENPVGKRLRFEDNPPDPWVTIVGLVGDARQLGLSQRPPALLYFPYEQFALPFTSVAVRSTLPPSAVASLLKSQLAGIDRDLSFGDIKPLQSVIDRSVDDPRFRATLIGVFAVLALALAAVGIYGLISYTVAQRTREFGIRIALGAARRQVLGPVIREGLVLAAIGTGFGLAGALIVGRALSAFLFGVGSSDPLTFGLVALVMLAVAFLATYVPSRRALKVDPVVALRSE